MNNEELPHRKLYHYTTKSGFLGIIENKTLWASQILFMNDEKEARIALEILDELLKEEKYSDIREKLKCEEKGFFDLCKSLAGFETYVISFSEKKDDLNMWRAYGDNASGICIEFDSDALLEALRKNHEKMELTFEKCIYDKQEQKEKIQDILNSVMENNKLNRELFLKSLLYLSTYFKDESFKDEHEWRIVVQLKTERENRKLKKTRVGKNVFVPYCELRIEKDKLPDEVEGEYPWLGDITVGCNTTDMFYKSVQLACFENGIGFCKVLKRDLQKSKSSYRGIKRWIQAMKK